MSYRTTLTIAAALVTFVLVLIGSVMAQAAQPQLGGAASAPTALVTTATLAEPAAAEPTVAPIVAPPPSEDPGLALLKERELEYRQLIEQANERIKVANDRIRVANREQQALVDRLRRAYAKQEELAKAPCGAAQP